MELQRAVTLRYPPDRSERSTFCAIENGQISVQPTLNANLQGHVHVTTLSRHQAPLYTPEIECKSHLLKMAKRRRVRLKHAICNAYRKVETDNRNPNSRNMINASKKGCAFYCYNMSCKCFCGCMRGYGENGWLWGTDTRMRRREPL